MKPYCFQYDDHNLKVIDEFFYFYKNNTLTDVNIHVEGKCIAAHKTILAVASPFLRSIFRTRKDTDLHFEDLQYESMKALIEYMYNGCLMVDYKYLTECLQLADSFKVRGISALYCDEEFTEPGPVSEEMQKTISELMSKLNVMETEEIVEKTVEIKSSQNELLETSSLPKLQLKRNASTGKWTTQTDKSLKIDQDILENKKCKTTITLMKRSGATQNAKENKNRHRKMANPKKFEIGQISKLQTIPDKTLNSASKNSLTSSKIIEHHSESTAKISSHVTTLNSLLVENPNRNMQNETSLQAVQIIPALFSVYSSNKTNPNFKTMSNVTKGIENPTAIQSSHKQFESTVETVSFEADLFTPTLKKNVLSKPNIQPNRSNGFQPPKASNLFTNSNQKQFETKPAQHVAPLIRPSHISEFKPSTKGVMSKAFIRRMKNEPKQELNSRPLNMQHGTQASQTHNRLIRQHSIVQNNFKASSQATTSKSNTSLNQKSAPVPPQFIQSSEPFQTPSSAPASKSTFYVQRTYNPKPKLNGETTKNNQRSLFSPELSSKLISKQTKASPVPTSSNNSFENKKEPKKPKKSKKDLDDKSLKQQYDVLFGENPSKQDLIASISKIQPKPKKSKNDIDDISTKQQYDVLFGEDSLREELTASTSKIEPIPIADVGHKNSNHNRVSEWHVDESDVFECDGEYEQHKNDPCPQPEELIKKERRVYGCPACNKAYTLKSNYRRHYVINHKRLDIAVYKCPMCESRFTRTDNRNQHIRKIHGFTDAVAVLSWDQPFHVCQMCKKGFTLEHELNRHTQMVHMNSYPMYL